VRLLRERHAEIEKFILYVDGARYFHCPLVKEWLQRHPEFQLSKIPAYSPNVNLIERVWKFLRKKALSRWHKTFEDMQAAVSEVLDKPLETWNISIRAPTSIPSWVPDQKHRMTLTVCSLPLRPVTVTFSVGQLGT